MTRLSDLPNLVGKQVTVELETDGDLPLEVTGQLLAVDIAIGIVVENRDGTVIIKLPEIKDVSVALPRTKLVRRMLRWMPPRQVKQHVLDRHGMPWDIIRAMSHQGVHDMHALIDHSNLGHRHQPKDEESVD